MPGGQGGQVLEEGDLESHKQAKIRRPAAVAAPFLLPCGLP
jgi:hypothetical protein